MPRWSTALTSSNEVVPASLRSSGGPSPAALAKASPCSSPPTRSSTASDPRPTALSMSMCQWQSPVHRRRWRPPSLLAPRGGPEAVLNAGPCRSACARRSSNQTVRYNDDGGTASKQHDRATAASATPEMSATTVATATISVVTDGSKAYKATVDRHLDRFHVIGCFAGGLTAVRRDVQRPKDMPPHVVAAPDFRSSGVLGHLDERFVAGAATPLGRARLRRLSLHVGCFPRPPAETWAVLVHTRHDRQFVPSTGRCDTRWWVFLRDAL